MRPNQGLIAPGDSETVSIVLVEKDKQLLLNSYLRLGQSALDHSKDKFLVQATKVESDFAGEASKGSKELTEALTALWNTSSDLPLVNKKLHVKHIVLESSSAPGAIDAGSIPPKSPSVTIATAAQLPPIKSMENMTPEQMFAEVSNLRRRYDELVAFSVNLTAERDILNNTLEQTKRDLNREMALRASLENSTSTGGAAYNSSSASIRNQQNDGLFRLTPMQAFILALVCFVMGMMLSKMFEKL